MSVAFSVSTSSLSSLFLSLPFFLLLRIRIT
jgi:hypothetical protein